VFGDPPEEEKEVDLYFQRGDLKDFAGEVLPMLDVGIYGSIKGEDCELIVLQYYTGARSLYIQEGRRDKGRKTAPSRCSGTQSCPDATCGPSSPDATSGPSSPSAHYSNTSPRTEYAKEHKRE